jgi:thiosulfate dehydrogenase
MRRNNRYPVLLGTCAALVCLPVHSDEFTQADLDRWQAEYMASVEKGEKLFHGGLKSNNTVSCDQCHPNATNIHPETYPKFQQQLGKVAVLGEMINWCIMNPLESDTLELDDPAMVDLQAYILHERRGTALAPGKH